jgi:murein L,D-transpeptidase YcbB/YkuD
MHPRPMTAFVATLAVAATMMALVRPASASTVEASGVSEDPVPATSAADLKRSEVATVPSGRARSAADQLDWVEDVEAFYAARAGTMLWHDEHGATERGRALMRALAAADDWGLDPAAYRVVPSVDLTPEQLVDADLRLTFAAIQYAKHAQDGRVAPEQLSRWLEGTAKPFSAATVLAALYSADDTGKALEGFHPTHVGFVRLKEAYVSLRDRPGKTNKELRDRIRANLERWRWLPTDLGRRYVWNNIPAFETQVFDEGREVFRERLVVGGVRTQTPVFSDAIRFVVFHPDWGVPPSLKVRDLLPRLASGDTSVLERRDMRIVGRPADSYDWNKIDIRRVPIVQNPGPSNPLGRVKFMFPNKHDVYMHDTPQKYLFDQKSRAASNGCIRVRDPLRFAEVLLGSDKGWAAGDIARLTARGAPENNRINLAEPVAVHTVYFTTVVDASRTLTVHPDIYGHDKRVTEALEGAPLERIRARDPAVAHQREIERLMEAKYVAPRRQPEAGWAPQEQRAPTYSGGAYPPWARGIFGGFGFGYR